MSRTVIPDGYRSVLNLYETQEAISVIKKLFQGNLSHALNLKRVSAPLFVDGNSGLNDNLNGVERPVSFDVLETGETAEVVHSLAKWKRLALKRYGFPEGTGLYTDMNAIRRDEDLDNLHSVYVDQWDWEKVITPQLRNVSYLKDTVKAIVSALLRTQDQVCRQFPILSRVIPEKITFLTTQELEDRYPDLTPKQREDAVCKEYGLVFLMQIGDKLRSGKPHDGRAPDYDDWALNGDILVWYPLLNRAVEISSMGIRVDEKSLKEQLSKANCESRAQLPFHKMLLEGQLPLMMGGVIGQSRICMLMLNKVHIGEVQAAVWSNEMIDACEARGVHLL